MNEGYHTTHGGPVKVIAGIEDPVVINNSAI